MKKSLVLAMAMALGVTASAYAANPFSDVPAGHWAYDSVAKLAAAGVVDGYGDGTYGGDKLMTRYEMAQIVARAMANGANVDKLAAEFADELDALGVRVAALEKKADAVKIAGQIRYHYANYGGDMDGHGSQLRSRIFINGQINDGWSYTGMLQNIQEFENDYGDEGVDFQRAFVTGKLGGVAVEAGRIDTTDITGGNIYDTRFDGVKLTYGDKIKLIGRAGKASNGKEAGKGVEADAYAAEAVIALGSGADLHGGYWAFKDIGSTADADNNIWTVGVNVDVAKDLQLTFDYLQSDEDDCNGDDDGFVIGLNYKGASASKVGSWGLNAKYYDQAESTVMAHTMNGDYTMTYTDNGVDVTTVGFKGYSLAGYYTVAKNIVAGIEWYDLESKDNAEKDMETLWTQLVFTF